MNCPSHHTLTYVSVDGFCCVCFCLAFQWIFWDVFPGGVDWNPNCTDFVVELHFVGWCLGVHTWIMYRYIHIYSIYIYFFFGVFIPFKCIYIYTCIYICIPFEIISTYCIYPLLYSCRLVILILPWTEVKRSAKLPKTVKADWVTCRVFSGAKVRWCTEVMKQWFTEGILDIFPPENSYVPKIIHGLKDESFIKFLLKRSLLGGHYVSLQTCR